jgi:hypothetical protein
MRNNCEVFVDVNVPLAVYNGVPFYISKNKVILSPGVNGAIDPKFIKRVTDKKGQILMKQQYEVVVYISIAHNLVLNYAMIDLVELKHLQCEAAVNLTFDSFINSKLTDDIRRRPFVIAIDKNKQGEYEEYLKKNYHQVKYLSAFTDYIPINPEIVCDIKEIEKVKESFNTANISQVKIDFKENKVKIEKFEKMVIDDEGIVKGNQQVKKEEDFKLTRDALKNPNLEKNYILMFLNYEEEDILTSIDCVLIPNSDISKFKSYTYTLELQQIKANLNNFLDGFKKFLESNVSYSLMHRTC